MLKRPRGSSEDTRKISRNFWWQLACAGVCVTCVMLVCEVGCYPRRFTFWPATKLTQVEGWMGLAIRAITRGWGETGALLNGTEI